jgi:hypothetical protein
MELMQLSRCSSYVSPAHTDSRKGVDNVFGINVLPIVGRNGSFFDSKQPSLLCLYPLSARDQGSKPEINAGEVGR